MATINPFQGPIDYSIDVQNPFEAAIGGFKIGAAGAEVQAQRQAQEKAQTYQKGIDTFFSKPAAQRTYSDIEPLLVGANKQQFDALQAVAKNMSDEKLNSSKRFTGQLLVALEQNPESAKTLLNDRIEAETDPQQKLAWQDALKGIDIAPQKVADQIELLGAATFGKDWYSGITDVRRSRETAAEAPAALRQKLADADAAESAAKSALAKANTAQEVENANRDLVKAQADKAKVDAQYAERVQLANLEKTGWDVKNLKSQISDRSARLGLEQQTTIANVTEKMATIQNKLNEIPADSRKLINEAATLAATSKQSANQMNDLAQRIETLGGYGAASRLGEFAKKSIGAEGYETGLRQEYTRLRNQAGIKSLPPGPATDKDIALALKGFPEDTANSKNIASFLRGMAKLQEIDAASNNAKTDWLAQNNGALTRAGKTFIAGDYTVKPGETFNDFNARVVSDVSKRYRSPEQMAEDKRAETMAKIPTTGTPAAAPTANVRAQADAILSGGR